MPDQMPSSDPRTQAIQKLNDEFRRSGAGGRTVVTSGINSLPATDQVEILRAVREFDEFTKENDPHGEHDFGIIKHDGESVYFKIDYYDKALEGGSEDPSDPQQTTRVMTIMLAHEY